MHYPRSWPKKEERTALPHRFWHDVTTFFNETTASYWVTTRHECTSQGCDLQKEFLILNIKDISSEQCAAKGARIMTLKDIFYIKK